MQEGQVQKNIDPSWRFFILVSGESFFFGVSTYIREGVSQNGLTHTGVKGYPKISFSPSGEARKGPGNGSWRRAIRKVQIALERSLLDMDNRVSTWLKDHLL
jgi:hypothetical protein